MREQFIFGYGSLINPESRARSVGVDRAGTSIPVVVNHLRRGWNARYKPDQSDNWPHSMTALGTALQKNARVNGVLVQVSEEDLKELDRRERGYVRRQLDFGTIEFLTKRKASFDAIVHAYLWDTPLPANEEFPIFQSYVDVVMTGCMELSKEQKHLGDFPAEFVRGTEGWDGCWIDDRSRPKYIRAMKTVPLSKEIDGILAGLIGPAFANRSIRP